MADATRTKRVLLLEDNADVLHLMRRLLLKQGFRVFAYPTVEEAEPHAVECDAHVALLDVHLPGRSGDEFGKDLAENCPGTRIIFVTAEADVDRLKREVPGCLVLRKPVDFDVLHSLMACD